MISKQAWYNILFLIVSHLRKKKHDTASLNKCISQNACNDIRYFVVHVIKMYLSGKRQCENTVLHRQ